MNQDTAPNVYDFPTREYGIQGRWPSPDPAGLAAVNPMDPQTWNRYAYVRNSPLEVTDPFGLCGGPGASSSGGIIHGYGGLPCPPPDSCDLPGVCDPPDPGGNPGGDPGGNPGGTQTTTQTKPQTPPCVDGVGPLAPGQSYCALQSQKEPCTPTDNDTKVIGTVFEAQHYIEAPFLFTLPLTFSGAVMGAFGVADAALCSPQPGVWVSCPVGIAVTGFGAWGILKFDYNYLKAAPSTWKSLTNREPTKARDSGC